MTSSHIKLAFNPGVVPAHISLRSSRSHHAAAFQQAAGHLHSASMRGDTPGTPKLHGGTHHSVPTSSSGLPRDP
eukprot:4808053-Alexandrium_andersonii.AAC.1